MTNDTKLDLRELIKIVRKRRLLIGGITFTFIVIVAIVSFLISPTYEAETVLRIKQPKGLADSLLADLPVGSSMMTKELMSTYSEILKSRTVVQDVIDKTQSGKEKIPRYEEFTKIITTEPIKDTEILKVKVQVKSPQEAQLIANTLVQTFIERLTTLVRSEQSAVRGFIGDRLVESQKELEKAETALQKYEQEQKIVAPDDETKAMVDLFSSINKYSAENSVAISAAQAKINSVEQQIGKEEPGFIADNPLIQQYKTKLADLEIQLVTLSQNYTDKHPQVLAIRAAINETKTNLNSEVAKVVDAKAASMNPVHMGLLQGKIQAEAELAAATAQKAVINRIINEKDKELSKLPDKMKGLARVMRNVQVCQEIYVMLAKRHEEARISEVMQPTDVQVVDEAVVPDKPVKPNKTLNILISAVLGLFMGVSTAVVLEYAHRTVRTVEDVQHYLDLPVLGNIPDFSERDNRQINLWTKLSQLKISKLQRGG